MFGNILSPKDGEFVGSKLRVKGIVSEKSEDQDLWLVHRRVSGGISVRGRRVIGVPTVSVLHEISLEVFK